MLSGFEILIPESHHIALKVEYNSCYQKEKRDKNVSGTREWTIKIFFYMFMLHCSHCTSDGPWQVNSVKLEDVLLSFKIWVSLYVMSGKQWCFIIGRRMCYAVVCVGCYRKPWNQRICCRVCCSSVSRCSRYFTSGDIMMHALETGLVSLSCTSSILVWCALLCLHSLSV